jgi:hypothetical protein
VALFNQAGFVDVAPIDPGTWPPGWHKEGLGARFQCGVKGLVPARDTDLPLVTGEEYAVDVFADDLAENRQLVDSARVEELQEQVTRILAMFVVEAELRNAAEFELDRLRNSRTFRLAVLARDAARRALPPGSERGRGARSLLRRLGSGGAEADGHR